VTSGAPAHWDDVKRSAGELGHLGGTWRDLGRAAGSVRVGVKRIEIAAGKWSTPVHAQGAEEEVFYVLGGSGLSWQDGAVYEIAEGDCIVHLPRKKAHTLRAGSDGLDVLAFGTRVPVELGYLPRAGVGWLSPRWVEVDKEPGPWQREVELGEPDVPEPSPRPANIVNLTDAPTKFGGLMRGLASAAGAQATGLNLLVLPPGGTGAPPHAHSADEEIFIVLAGTGTLELTPTPPPGEKAAVSERHDLRPGSVVARPAATRVAHAFRAGDAGMTLLLYGTREPNDICYYPRSDKVYFRGIGVMARLERLTYMDGEPA
jgi:uncharacterized cupin superfamily protein